MRASDVGILERALLAANAPPAPDSWLKVAEPDFDGPDAPKLDEELFGGLERERAALSQMSVREALDEVVWGLRVIPAGLTLEQKAAAEVYLKARRAHVDKLREERQEARERLALTWRWHWADEMLRAKAAA